MIPQPLKWVGTILVLVILVLVVAPIAYESMLGTVTFSDEGGLFGGGDDDLAEAEAGEGGEDGEPEGEPTEEPTERPDSYVVETGDTLFSIAEEIYGEGGRWVDIAEANEIDLEGGSITAGEELVIP